MVKKIILSFILAFACTSVALQNNVFENNANKISIECESDELANKIVEQLYLLKGQLSISEIKNNAKGSIFLYEIEGNGYRFSLHNGDGNFLFIPFSTQCSIVNIVK